MLSGFMALSFSCIDVLSSTTHFNQNVILKEVKFSAMPLVSILFSFYMCSLLVDFHVFWNLTILTYLNRTLSHATRVRLKPTVNINKTWP